MKNIEFYCIKTFLVNKYIFFTTTYIDISDLENTMDFHGNFSLQIYSCKIKKFLPKKFRVYHVAVASLEFLEISVDVSY